MYNLQRKEMQTDYSMLVFVIKVPVQSPYRYIIIDQMMKGFIMCDYSWLNIAVPSSETN